MDVNGQRYEVNYWPGDSLSGMFGGNSNWRGPICEVYFLMKCTYLTVLRVGDQLPVDREFTAIPPVLR